MSAVLLRGPGSAPSAKLYFLKTVPRFEVVSSAIPVTHMPCILGVPAWEFTWCVPDCAHGYLLAPTPRITATITCGLWKWFRISFLLIYVFRREHWWLLPSEKSGRVISVLIKSHVSQLLQGLRNWVSQGTLSMLFLSALTRLVSLVFTGTIPKLSGSCVIKHAVGSDCRKCRAH